MYKLNQIVVLNKNHVCKNNMWIVKRVGIDIKLECMKCHREFMIKSFELDKKIKKILSKKEIEILKELESEQNRGQDN